MYLNVLQTYFLLPIGMDAARIVTAARDRIFPRNQWGMVVRNAIRVMEQSHEVSVEWIGREEHCSSYSSEMGRIGTQ
jgi:hypothetical protein